jgi:hypothetical protein
VLEFGTISNRMSVSTTMNDTTGTGTLYVEENGGLLVVLPLNICSSLLYEVVDSSSSNSVYCSTLSIWLCLVLSAEE